MNSEKNEPKNVLADSTKIEHYAAIARLFGGFFALMFIVFFVLVVAGVGKKPSIVPPLGFSIFSFCIAFVLGLVAKSKKAIEDLEERVSELERR